MHGHLRDGLVIDFVEIKAVPERLFPVGLVDRTDLRAVSQKVYCVTQAQVGFESKSAAVTFDDQKTTISRLIEATQNAGYPSF